MEVHDCVIENPDFGLGVELAEGEEVVSDSIIAEIGNVKEEITEVLNELLQELSRELKSELQGELNSMNGSENSGPQ